jgi:hypothetical protein
VASEHSLIDYGAPDFAFSYKKSRDFPIQRQSGCGYDLSHVMRIAIRPGGRIFEYDEDLKSNSNQGIHHVQPSGNSFSSACDRNFAVHAASKTG